MFEAFDGGEYEHREDDAGMADAMKPANYRSESRSLMNAIKSFFSRLMSFSIDGRIDELRASARAQLAGVKVTSGAPALWLDGSTAEVCLESENVVHDDGRVDGFYLTQVVRNSSGEYFLLKTTDRRPYVQHLPQARAKVVLKGRYIRPGSAR